MGLKQFPQQQPYCETRLAWLLDAVDELHGAVSEGELETLTNLSEFEVISWLREVIWVAQETLTEMEQRKGHEPRLTLVRKSS
ncbi:MAG: hypothetical protein KC547_14655 [Anaerolineae bacterium]|nr:hypothetical protein [Anaerolineae bacterium]MCA9907228.1 hypothetical protein [Anaerolineae bacterium]